MAVHQRHPSIVALSAKKRVKQFKQLFNNNNTSSYSNHKSNDSILELQKRCLVNGGLNYESKKSRCNKGKRKGKTKGKDKGKTKLSVIPQPIHCHALPTWLEASDDDEFTQYTDYSDDTDLDNINQQMSMSMSSSDLTICDENDDEIDDENDEIEQTLAICAT